MTWTADTACSVATMILSTRLLPVFADPAIDALFDDMIAFAA